ncbi:MAG: FecR protein [Gemmatimonadetes bacterium]|nr:FecR protein [Gemmatimonadota bacterium]
MADDRAQRPEIDAEWESLARYLAGECGPEEEHVIRDQLARNAEQGAMLAALDAALTTTTDQPLSTAEIERALQAVRARAALEDASGGHQRDIVPLLREGPTARLARMRWQWRHAGLRAAAAVLVVAGASMLWRATHHSGPSGAAARSAGVASIHYASAVGKVDSIRLSDGSKVVLGPASRLDVAGGYGSASRDVVLHGEAFFDVVHDERVPFVVRTSHATMRDVGTSFTVRSDVDGGTRVAVTTGAVSLVAAHGGAGASVVLRAGDRAVTGANGVQLERGTVSNDDLSWTHGLLVFRDAPLTEVTVGLRRWFGIELVVTDSLIATRRLNATFDGGTVDDVGRVLAAALGGSVRRSGDTLRLGSATNTR